MLGNNCAVPSSANCLAGPALVSQVPVLHQFQLGPGVFPPLPPPSFIQQASPYLTASAPQLSVNLGSYAGLTGTSGLQELHQLHQLLPAYTRPPGPPSDEGTAAVNTAAAAPSGIAARPQPSTSRGRQQSVSAVRPQDSTSDQRTSSVRRKRKSRRSRSRGRKRKRRSRSSRSSRSTKRRSRRRKNSRIVSEERRESPKSPSVRPSSIPIRSRPNPLPEFPALHQSRILAQEPEETKAKDKRSNSCPPSNRLSTLVTRSQHQQAKARPPRNTTNVPKPSSILGLPRGGLPFAWRARC